MATDEIETGRDIIIDALLSDRGLQYMVDAASEVLGLPISIYDPGHKVLAMTDVEIDDPFWSRQRLIGYAPYDEMLETIRLGFGPRLLQSHKPFVHAYECFEHRWMIDGIRVRGVLAGYIAMMEYSRVFSDSDKRLIHILASAAGCELQKQKSVISSPNLMIQYLLSDLIDSGQLNPVLVEQRAAYLRMRLKKHLYVVAMDFIADSHDFGRLAYIMDRLIDKLPGGTGLIREGRAVILLSTDNDQYFSDYDFYVNMADFLKENKIICGVSREFGHLAEFPLHYRQAMTAMELGRRVSTEAAFFHYDDLAIFDLIDAAAKSADIKGFCNPRLTALIEDDEAGNTGLAKTLYYYLLNFGNAAKTARQLRIHRNTMDYRLRKIEETMRINLQNAEQFQQLLTSFNILFYHLGQEFKMKLLKP